MIETKFFQTSMEPGKFILTKVKRDAEIELEDAQANTAAVLEISKGENFPILVDLREIKSITKEAREHFSMKGRKPHVTAIAMLINSPVSKIVGNFFLSLNHPVVPTRLFTSQQEAIYWMKRNS